ncbi:MAG TPA: NAD-dependent epimerase/dehydratase family protein [Candidatus Scybalomonas excrementigallinarum]|nr:NAD-dependent epimerase/dehydratase family protein [Candidatus Scybalomonas excrementigallinarum]
MKKVLIIGKNSYIAKKFMSYISNRKDTKIEVGGVSASNGEWRETSFKGYDSVLFLAGKVHQKETSENKKEYDEINYKLAVSMAKKAKNTGVKQFIYMSTAAVYGNGGQERGNVIIDENTPLVPETAYGISKRKAEIALLQLEEKYNQEMKVCIVRPPMVYGDNCPGNFMRLWKVALKVPVFPLIHNKRSMIAIDNLCEFLYQMIMKEKRGIYHPQDKEYVETSKLVGYIRKQKGKGILYVKMFNAILRVLVKKVGVVEKVFGDYKYKKEISEYEGVVYQKYRMKDVVRKIL